ncbi:MAG: sigma 54-interacting transcriptional regulator [candidate division Zixibacteria bacterium]|nr:sigma 54-interacting transcriptional regulator [candidate division Zixibacteria bacterium]
MTETGSDQGRLQTALDELRLINNVVGRICQIRELNHIMSIILTELTRATDADQGVISMVSRLGEDALRTVVRNNQPRGDELPFKISQSLAGWVLSHKQVLRVDDLDADNRFGDLNSDNGRYKSAICCPLLVRDEAIGLISLVRSSAKPAFTDDQCRLAGILAAQSAQILANAKLLTELASKNELLEMSLQRTQEENAQLRTELQTGFAFERIIGTSPGMRRVLTLASKFCVNDSPVLITGETGTGKELIARAIHANSARRGKPFVVKNCGIKTESLLESELFGHIRGAFTGADRDKPGLFREAQNGTIFLDEIGDAPLSTQAAILRVIQHGEIRPVGSSKTETVNVRVLSATNKNLREEITRGNFREDLFYRLNTFTIEIPPLRERRDDIPLLVTHCLAGLRVKTGNPDLSISSEALDALIRYHWPGNVRQIEHELERAAVVCNPSASIELHHLSPEILDAVAESPGLGAPHGQLRQAVEKLERSLIAATLSENDNNIMRTANSLGLTRKGLKDKMARYGMRGND